MRLFRSLCGYLSAPISVVILGLWVTLSWSCESSLCVHQFEKMAEQKTCCSHTQAKPDHCHSTAPSHPSKCHCVHEQNSASQEQTKLFSFPNFITAESRIIDNLEHPYDAPRYSLHQANASFSSPPFRILYSVILI